MSEAITFNKSDRSWITSVGQAATDIEDRCYRKVAERISAGNYRAQDLEYIARLDLPAVKGTLKMTDRQLEKLRRLCQLAEVDLIPAHISSHRPVIGPVIVAAKRILFSILKVLFKDTLRKQRDFNAAVISFLAEGQVEDRPDRESTRRA